MTREDDSQHKLSGQQCTSTQRICPQMHYKHAQRADDISGVAVGNAGARFGAGAVQPGNWRCAADQHRNAMSSTERGRMILLRSVLDVGWSAARRTGKKSSSEADERHGSGTRAHPTSAVVHGVRQKTPVISRSVSVIKRGRFAKREHCKTCVRYSGIVRRPRLRTPYAGSHRALPGEPVARQDRGL